MVHCGIALFILIATGICTRAQKSEDERNLYDVCLEALETATASSNTQFLLQKIFYPPDRSESHTIQINVTALVNRIITPHNVSVDAAFRNCSYPDCACNSSAHSCWTRSDVFLWSTDSTSMSHAKLLVLFRRLRPVLSIIQALGMYVFSMEDFGDRKNEYGINGILGITLAIDELPRMPLRSEYIDALTSVLTWVKAYVKSPFSKDNVIVPRDLTELRGLVLLKLSSDQYTEDVPFISLDSHGLLLAVTLSLVCFVTLTVATLIKGTFLVINDQIAKNDYLYSLYWGTAYVLGWYNFSNAYGGFIAGLPVSYYAAIWPITFILLQYILLPTFELCLVVWAVLYPVKQCTAPPPLVLANVFCCCFWFKRTSFHSQLIHILALVNIIWFVQTILVPGAVVTVFPIMLKPPAAIALVFLIFSGVVCLVMFSSVVVYLFKTQDEGPKWWFCLKFVVSLILTLLMISVYLTVLMLYLSLVSNGLEVSGIKGIVLALIPPAALSVLGLVVRKKVLERSADGHTATDQQRGAPQHRHVAIQMSDDNVSNLGDSWGLLSGSQSTNTQ